MKTIRNVKRVKGGEGWNTPRKQRNEATRENAGEELRRKLRRGRRASTRWRGRWRRRGGRTSTRRRPEGCRTPGLLSKIFFQRLTK